MDIPVKKCKKCHEVLHSCKLQCPICLSDDLELTTIKGEGTIYSYTKIHTAPKQFADQVPYYVVLIQLDGLNVTGRFIGEDVQINDFVVLEDIKNECYYFKPVSN
ncbi:Zn-ribbon domain-containing OB-fold protein [Salicibibacter kimchii]|uniref:Nucleic acid-binding protein n=1 Tax=Salicibibacter kimchii TaxID=2099786 RepID=A0A345BWD3_9BACI|nr:OB-fold domain-containing protein [Salicibibacter kimchii]AXF55264.1 nucleic acid-binding protein [Salicibibacter kimchii]